MADKLYTDRFTQENETTRYIRDSEATHEEDIVYIIDEMIDIVSEDVE